jgi:homogentisate phytyltransferase/homogentisate geranylgeranyltransferase
MSQISSKPSSIPPSPASKRPFVQRWIPWLYAFWKFSRPHTIVGTTLSVLGLFCLAVATHHLPGGLGFSLSSLVSVLLALMACLCGNVYIVGLNQLEDVDIDRVNKPHLPLASGEFSRLQAQVIVSLTGVLAIALALSQGPYLLLTVGLSLFIGTAYSLPPIRLKRFPFWASCCIFTVRGAVVNLGVFTHFSESIWHSTQIPAAVWTLTLFILGFTFAIALFKDIPDIEGDRRYNISTFTLRLGQRAVFNLSRWVLTACYSGMIVAGIILPSVNSLWVILPHGLLLSWFWYQSLQVNLDDKRAIARFYQFIWKLFFLEYLIFPVAWLLSR